MEWFILSEANFITLSPHHIKKDKTLTQYMKTFFILLATYLKKKCTSQIQLSNKETTIVLLLKSKRVTGKRSGRQMGKSKQMPAAQLYRFPC